jgi:hypothetical protein
MSHGKPMNLDCKKRIVEPLPLIAWFAAGNFDNGTRSEITGRLDRELQCGRQSGD